jgi:transcriptional regulator with XRE-family HTH domain
MMDQEVARRIEMLRKRCGLSIRQLAQLSGVTAGMISCIERGKNSPSILTLQKLLHALKTDLATFFAVEKSREASPIFLREHMTAVSDAGRTYTIVYGKQPNVQIEMLDETIRPTKRRPPFESHKCDVAGYLLSGNLVLEIKGEAKQVLRPGDAFYIPKGQEHRGYVEEPDAEPVRLIATYHPARY